MSQEIFADIMYVNVCMCRGQHCGMVGNMVGGSVAGNICRYHVC